MSNLPVGRKPEIMSPAGYWPQLDAAIEAGADAVYFGLTHFTARAKVGFKLEELPMVMRTLHRRGVKGYVTFNTLVFDHELQAAGDALAAIARAGADAIIVQDLGVARYARRLAPDLEIHGSTQMSISDQGGLQLAADLGIRRVVLARELALPEIRMLANVSPIELEIFVHGALCISYSGQCFSSEAWGGRSANRGQCAQACRLPYDLLVDGERKPLGAARYLLSPGDLSALTVMPDVVRSGVSALKIEGRYKDAEYVALTTDAYRRALDAAWQELPTDDPAYEELRLGQIYSRGLGAYFLSGTNHQTVVDGRAPRHRGLLMGRVVQVGYEAVIVEPAEAHEQLPLKAGDGVVFDAADRRSPEEREEGGRLYTVDERDDGRLVLRFGPGMIEHSRIAVGDLLWRSNDPAIEREARRYTQPASPAARQALAVEVHAAVGAPLRLDWHLIADPRIAVSVASEMPLSAAARRPLDEVLLHEQLGRLGDTAYQLERLTATISGDPFVPTSLLNALRRAACDALTEQQGSSALREIAEPQRVLQELSSPPVEQTTPMRPALHLLVRNAEQLHAARELQPDSITLDYLDFDGLRPALLAAQSDGVAVRVAAPRMLKPDEQRLIDFLQRLQVPLLVRSTGLLQQLHRAGVGGLHGDFSLNAANHLSADLLLNYGLERLTLTHDLNAAQIRTLAERLGGERLEVVAYHHLPVFHTEHCVFCRFLSKGTSYKDCGRPCEKHTLALRDSQGRAHPVLADVGCRNTVFGAEAQQASKHIDSWRAAGIGHFRLEFVHEDAEQLTAVTLAFQDYLGGTISADQLNRRLQEAAPQGVSEGSLFVPTDHTYIPLF